jgi:hypothetical protein
MKRLWGIRHVRYFYLKIQLYRWVDYCQSVGFGIEPNPADMEYLDRVWRGTEDIPPRPIDDLEPLWEKWFGPGKGDRG